MSPLNPQEVSVNGPSILEGGLASRSTSDLKGGAASPRPSVHGRKIFSFISVVFIFILLSDLIGLIPTLLIYIYIF